MGKMNIMYIFNDKTMGGATQSLIDMLNELKDEINPIVVMREDSGIECRFAAINIRFYKIRFSTDHVKIGSASKAEREFDIKQSYEAAMQLLPIIRKEKVQLIHINSSISYFAAIAALMANIPYVWHIRELLEEHCSCEFLNDGLKRDLFARADSLIAISDYVQQRYQEKYALNILRIYNGLNIERFKSQINDNKDYKNIFLVASMITPEKRQWDAVRATELLVEKGYNNIKLIIAGGGTPSYIWAMKKYIVKKNLERNIFIISFQDDLSKLRSQALCSITCSQSEAMGRVTVESMLAGNVVIGARSGATTEIIGENEERGFLYELGNIHELADTMLKVMKYPDEKRNFIRKSAQVYAEKNFDSKIYSKSLFQLYEKTISTFETNNQTEFLDSLKEHYNLIKDMKDLDKQDSIVQYQKSIAAFGLALKWLEIRQKGHSLNEYFEKNNIKDIAIYGMADLGCRLYDELDGSVVNVKYLIDRDPGGMEKILRFTSLNGEKIKVDVIVVTVASAEKSIINEIHMNGYDNVIGLSEVLDSFDIVPIEK